MKKTSAYIVKHLRAYLLATACMLIAVSLDMVYPYLEKHIVDDVIVGNDLSLLTPLLIGIFSVGMIRCITEYGKEYLFDRTGAKIASEMRTDLFHHIQGLSAEFFDRNNTGELMARIKDDIDRIWDGLSFVGMLTMQVIVHVTMVLFCMYRLNWKLAIIPTLTMILCGWLAIFMEKKLGPIYEAISEENARLNTVAEENLQGVRTVKAFAREKFEIKKFLSHNQRYYDLNMKQSSVFVKYHPYFSLITKVLPLVILLQGGFFYIRGEMTLGDLWAFLEYSGNIVWPMEMLGWLTNCFSSAVASNKKLKKIYAEKPVVIEKESPVVLPDVHGKIVFDHVSFKRNDRDILKDVSFTVEPGTTVGIMGATGSGKSSLIHLLVRQYDCTNGSISLDGVNIKDLSFAQLRQNIGVVSQDVFLFSDTIRDNIQLGKKDCTSMEMIEQASFDAQADDFISNLTDRYNTVIGERGVGLSGGQKQRISIARSFVKNTPVLVMDDSTSALDMETEHAIQETLKKMDPTTKIIIAHRISAVRNADQILILKDGMIAEHGTHEELLALKGLYYETYLAQYGEFLEPDKSGRKED